MIGLILYGIMQGVTSLRTLERMARVDLGCMWVSGGIFPDHAIIGRFINMHRESMTGDFFENLTRAVLKKTDSDGRCLAGDGAVIEAACSSRKPLSKLLKLHKRKRIHILIVTRAKRVWKWLPVLTKRLLSAMKSAKRTVNQKALSSVQRSRKLLSKR